MSDAEGGYLLATQQSPQFAPKLLPGRGIQGGEGLIEQQESWTVREHARERHPLLLPTGELGRTSVFQPLELKKANHFIKPHASFPAVEVVYRIRDVPGDRQMGKEGIVLEQVADPARLRRRHDAHVRVQPRLARKPDAPALGPLQSGEAAQDRRLARSRRSKEDSDMRTADRKPKRRTDCRPSVVPFLEVGCHLSSHTAHTFRLRA